MPVGIDRTVLAALVTSTVALVMATFPLIFTTSVSRRLWDLQVERLLKIDEARNTFTQKAQACFKDGNLVAENEVMDPYNRFCELLVTSEALLGARWVNDAMRLAEQLQDSIWKNCFRVPGAVADPLKCNQLYNVRRHLMLEHIRAKFSWSYRVGGIARRCKLRRAERLLTKQLGPK